MREGIWKEDDGEEEDEEEQKEKKEGRSLGVATRPLASWRDDLKLGPFGWSSVNRLHGGRV